VPDLHADFAAALAGDTRRVLGHLRGNDAADAATRFAVHARNRRHALTDALAANFPVVAELVGEAFFRALAAEFIREHPPRTPSLLLYGEELPRFIDAFAPAQTVACLADVARLECAWNRACHAAEAQPLGLSALAALSPESLLHCRLRLHPSVQVVGSKHPVVSLWRAHREGRTHEPLATDAPESGLVLRPIAEVEVLHIDAALATFVVALSRGESIAQAARGPEAAAQLALLFDRGAVIGLETLAEDTPT
jgi:hypothetical protein